MNTASSDRTPVAYWLVTGLFAAGIIGSGLTQVAHTDFMVQGFRRLGYPQYLLTLLGSWKVLGGLVLVLPGWLLAKEWAYAGFFFLLTGAIVAHVAAGDHLQQVLPSALFLALLSASWYLRPAQRRLPNPAAARRPSVFDLA